MPATDGSFEVLLLDPPGEGDALERGANQAVVMEGQRHDGGLTSLA